MTSTRRDSELEIPLSSSINNLNDNENSKGKRFKCLSYGVIFLPMLAVYLPTVIFPFKQDIGKDVPFRPPGYVFAIVWPILLFLVGISWFLRRYSGYIFNIGFSLLSVVLAIWYILYDINKVYGLIDIVSAFVLTVFLATYKFKYLESLLLLPLAGWLVFASILNIYSI
jgi:tryptophan-rich sensory protein|tara:strand:+ start:48 stop:554 length:507 start_codon:yes stop_codon:yes gene_type:complete